MASDKSSGSNEALFQQAAEGDVNALAALFDQHQRRLKQMVRLRLDRRLKGRVDPSDVLQDAFLDLSQELPSYAQKRSIPLFLWMRLVVGQRLMRVHRQHLGTEMRDAAREISLNQGVMPQATSASLAAQLMGHYTSATKAAIRAEVQLQLQQALNSMEPIDREIIALRNLEELDNGEAAAALGLSASAASKRYVRALKRLQGVLLRFPGLLDDK